MTPKITVLNLYQFNYKLTKVWNPGLLNLNTNLIYFQEAMTYFVVWIKSIHRCIVPCVISINEWMNEWMTLSSVQVHKVPSNKTEFLLTYLDEFGLNRSMFKRCSCQIKRNHLMISPLTGVSQHPSLESLTSGQRTNILPKWQWNL